MSRRSRLIRAFARGIKRAAQNDPGNYWPFPALFAWDDHADMLAMRHVRWARSLRRVPSRRLR